MSVLTMGQAGATTSRRALLGVAAPIFAAGAAATVARCASMPAMGGMPMLWMPMPGQPWPVAWASFLGMWIVMTVAMMLPSLTGTLWRRPGPALTSALIGLGYFTVWTGFGAAAFPVGAALAFAEMRLPAPGAAAALAAGAAVVLAGCWQLTPAKARDLACCRETYAVPGSAGGAWRGGLRLGLDCVRCCAGLMIVLLVTGAADLRAMAVVGAAITAERLAPGGTHVARAIGVVLIGTGLFLIARAAGL